MDKHFRAAIAAMMISPFLMCSSTFGTICEAIQICEGGNDKDVSACKASLASEQDVASIYGCSAEYSKAFDCSSTKGACVDKRYNADGCRDLSIAYLTCKNAASATKGSNR
jgi:hypothetical protein